MPDTDDGDSGNANPRARWDTGADGIEQIGAVVETEDRTTPEQRARNEKAAEIRDQSAMLARRLAKAGEHDDDDDAAAEKSDTPRKD